MTTSREERELISKMVADQLDAHERKFDARLQLLERRVDAVCKVGSPSSSAPPIDGGSPRTASWSDGLAARVLGAVQGYLQRSLAPMGERLKAVNTRLDQLEARPALKYSGVWQEGLTYEAGEFATHDGSLWHCNHSTTGRPGHGSGDWRLAVKKGRDGKDGLDSGRRA